jgi:transcriptional regulator with XRE-family HTH domain
MNETTNPTALVTSQYRKANSMTYRAFADALNKSLVNTGISHQSVANWEKGMTDPNTDMLLNCLVVYPVEDWRTQWAIDCLVAKLPVVFDRDEERKLLILSAAAHHAMMVKG